MLERRAHPINTRVYASRLGCEISLIMNGLVRTTVGLALGRMRILSRFIISNISYLFSFKWSKVGSEI